MAINDDRAVVDLPHALGAFIGRAGEIAEILSLLATARLFTLTGMGGSGKTRLAAQVATQMHVTFGNGVAYVTSGRDGGFRVHALGDGSLIRRTAVPVGSYNVQRGPAGTVITGKPCAPRKLHTPSPRRPLTGGPPGAPSLRGGRLLVG